jgi:hypothetical protein
MVRFLSDRQRPRLSPPSAPGRRGARVAGQSDDNQFQRHQRRSAALCRRQPAGTPNPAHRRPRGALPQLNDKQTRVAGQWRA